MRAGPQAFDQGGLVRIEGAREAVCAHEDRPAVLAAGGHAGDVGCLEGFAGRHQLAPGGGDFDVVRSEHVLVVVDAAVGNAAQVDRVDLAVVRAGVLDRRIIVVLDERLVGDVHQQAGLDQGLPVGRGDVLHVGLGRVGEAEDVDDIHIVGGQAGLGDGAQVVGVHDRHIHGDVGILGLELLVEGFHELDHRGVLVDEDLQGYLCFGWSLGRFGAPGRSGGRSRCCCAATGGQHGGQHEDHADEGQDFLRHEGLLLLNGFDRNGWNDIWVLSRVLSVLGCLYDALPPSSGILKALPVAGEKKRVQLIRRVPCLAAPRRIRQCGWRPAYAQWDWVDSRVR